MLWKILLWLCMPIIAGSLAGYLAQIDNWQTHTFHIIALIALCIFYFAYTIYLFIWIDTYFKDITRKEKQAEKLKNTITKGMLFFVTKKGAWLGVFIFLIWVIPGYIRNPEANFPTYKLLFMLWGYPIAIMYWFFLKKQYKKHN